jgi:NADH-quinone oxidoreductase subunit L
MGLLAWAWVFALPGLVLTAAGLPTGQRRAGWLSLPGPLVLLVVSLVAVATGPTPVAVTIPNWLPFLPDGAYQVLADQLSAVMLVILGFVASLVYVYSLGYMADDPSRRRFFVYLDLFVATMSLLVLAGNLAVLLIGWTGVGISSFLLIAFWRDRAGTLSAGLQALAANAIGDAALLLAAALVPSGCGALVGLAQPSCTSGFGGAELIALLLFVAAAAKSAQGPLYFWLPSAMAGPTPISALIHAATMVAAGVYLLVRTYALFALAPTVSLWVAGIGTATAVAASFVSLLQPNFKRGIAYSTVAQLGYMFAAAGVGVPFAAFFHLFTHASFKALLFLAAGVVIHGQGGEELLARLSGTGRRYPYSYWGFLIGSLALIGVPLFSGAFSKDLIIESSVAKQPVVGYLLLATVFLTGLYIGRLFFRVYHGQPASPLPPGEGGGEGHEDVGAQRAMNWALVPLMVAAIFAGWVGDRLEAYETPVVGPTPFPIEVVSPLGLVGAALGLVGFGIAWWYVRQRRPAPAPAEPVPTADGWVAALADAGYAVAGALARVQSGLLARYAFGSLFALALVVFITAVVGR